MFDMISQQRLDITT